MFRPNVCDLLISRHQRAEFRIQKPRNIDVSFDIPVTLNGHNHGNRRVYQQDQSHSKSTKLTFLIAHFHDSPVGSHLIAELQHSIQDLSISYTPPITSVDPCFHCQYYYRLREGLAWFKTILG